MKRIMVLLTMMALMMVMLAMSVAPVFAVVGGGNDTCMTRPDGTVNCSGGGSSHNSYGNTGGGRHLSYDPKTGVTTISGGGGYGGGGTGGGGGGHCTYYPSAPRECHAGGSYF